MKTNTDKYEDLYADCCAPYVTMPANVTFDDIKKEVSKGYYEHRIKAGDKCIIAKRKFTWKGNVAKTSYLHIWHVKSFDGPIRVISHWREQKNGNFKLL